MNEKMNKLINTLIPILIILLVLVLIIGIKKDKEKQKVLDNYVSKQVNNPTKVKNVTTANKAKESKTASGTYIYDKLTLGQKASALILGDSIGGGLDVNDSGKWYKKLDSLLASKYKAGIETSLSCSPVGSVFDGWSSFSSSKDNTKYDTVFICYGENDVASLTIKQFQNTYESLIRKIKASNAKCEIYLIIENSNQINNDMLTTIDNLAKYYDLETVDLRNSSNDAQTDCANKVMALINTNIQSKRAVSYSEKECQYDGTNNMDTYNFTAEASQTNGFTNSDGSYSSDVRGNNLSYKFTGSFVGIKVKCGNSYGKVNVYLNGKLMKVFDCYASSDCERQILCYDGIHKGNNGEIKIEVSGNKNANSTGNKISVLGVISN